MLTLLTMTGSRPAAFALCKRWMAAQTYSGPVRWIVVDDGGVPTDVSGVRPDWTVDHVRREPYWRPGQNTQRANILAGLARHREDPLAIIEDDDYYAPGYLDGVSQWLRRADLVGEASSRYYHVRDRRWYDNGNDRHASLCCTAVQGPGVVALRRAAAEDTKFVDMVLWRRFTGPRFLARTRMTVGIKGLPGRPGIGSGHRMGERGEPDPDGRVLRSWIGEDADAYLDL